jgi:DNA-binding MarR family transcriptional regulator
LTEDPTTVQTDAQTPRQTSAEPLGSAENRESAVALRLAITRTSRRLRQEAATDLSPTAIAALASIERHAPVTPTRLAEIERVQRPTITRVINALAEAGAITREPDPDDGRSCRLSVTEAGAARLAGLRFRKSAYLARLLDSLPDEDVQVLERASQILERALEEPAR